MRKILFACLSAALCMVPMAGFASCPDQAVCQLYYNGNQEYGTRVGIIDTPTCYKVGHQCRPWNCSGNNTSSDYWIDQCIQRFNVKHIQGRTGEKICVTFPSVKTSVDGRVLFTKDWCRDIK